MNIYTRKKILIEKIKKKRSHSGHKSYLQTLMVVVKDLDLRNRHACFVLPCLINMVAITRRSFTVNEVQNGGKQKKVSDVGDDSSANRQSPSSISRTSLAPEMSPKVGFMTGNGFRAGVTGSPAVHFSSRTF